MRNLMFKPRCEIRLCRREQIVEEEEEVVLETIETKYRFVRNAQQVIARHQATGRSISYLGARSKLERMLGRSMTKNEKSTLTNLLAEASNGFILSGLNSSHQSAVYMGEYRPLKQMLNGRTVYDGPNERKAWFHDGDWVFGELTDFGDNPQLYVSDDATSPESITNDSSWMAWCDEKDDWVDIEGLRIMGMTPTAQQTGVGEHLIEGPSLPSGVFTTTKESLTAEKHGWTSAEAKKSVKINPLAELVRYCYEEPQEASYLETTMTLKIDEAANAVRFSRLSTSEKEQIAAANLGRSLLTDGISTGSSQ